MRSPRLLNVVMSLILLVSSSSITGCKKKKKSEDNRTTSGGGVQPPAPIAPIPPASLKKLTLNTTGDGSGTLSTDPAGPSCGPSCVEFSSGTAVTVIQTPSDNLSVFSGWSDACTGNGTCVVAMDIDQSVTALFEKDRRTLTISKSGDGSGQITSLPAGIECGSDCTESFVVNTNVSLTATAADSISQFSGWSGACTGTGPCSVTMDSAKNATATFSKIQQTLTVTISGDGDGKVTSSPPGIDCGADCSEDYVLNTPVTLTAIPTSATDAFDQWTGACTGAGPCSVTMDAAKNVTATFSKIQQTLTVTTSGDGDGQITSTPPGISCGIDCTEDYDNGTSVTLTAAPADRFSEFISWSGACTGNAGCSVTLTEAKNVSAEFRKVRKTLTTTISGPGTRGKVTSVPGGIDCGLDCSEDFLLEDIVSLAPTPADASSEFDHWSGACTGSADCSVTMSDNESVEAVFRISQKTLDVTKGGNGTGTVTSNPTGIDCGSDCSETYNYNTVVTLTQTQGSGYFTGWSGACSGDKSCRVTMNEVKTVQASFGTGSVDGDYCQSTPGLIFCFFVRSNAVVEVAEGPDTSHVCRFYFYSGNRIADHAFNADNGSTQIAGNFLSAYRVAGHFNGSCSFLSTNSFDYETTRPGASSAAAVSSLGGFSGSERLTYNPDAK